MILRTEELKKLQDLNTMLKQNRKLDGPTRKITYFILINHQLRLRMDTSSGPIAREPREGQKVGVARLDRMRRMECATGELF